MFGRHDDVIKQDQQRDAKVLLPPSAVSALVKPPAEKSDTDSPAPTTDSSSEPPLYSTSIDGFSAPTGSLTNPLSYSRTPANPGRSSSTTDATDEPPEPDMEPIELSNEGAENATYMQHIASDDTPDEDTDVATQPFANNPADSTEPEKTQPEPDGQPAGNQQIPADGATNGIAITSPDDGADASLGGNTQKAVSPEDLLNLKQAALQELSPLVNKLNLGPEEKFRTLMMLIQASDDQSLLSEAHETAKTIGNEKARAQALLDIVNEINYFTTKKDS